MTPKEKAQYLIDKFKRYGELAEANWANGTENDLALICVEEILDLDSGDSVGKSYWYQVKRELEKL